MSRSGGGAVLARPKPWVSRKRWPTARQFQWFWIPGALFLAATAVYPLVTLAKMSVSDVNVTNVVGDWRWVGVANFRALLTSGDFWSSVVATVLFTGGLLTFDISLGLLVAVIAWRSSRLVTAALTVMIFAWALPPIVNGSVWSFMLRGDGLINAALALFHARPILWLADPKLALWSVMFVVVWASMPFATVVIRARLLGISRDVIDAAAIDGAGPWATTWHITIPHLRPVLAVLGVLITVYGFRGFDYIFVMTQGGPGNASATLPVLAYKQAFQLSNYSLGAAISVIGMVIVVALAAVYVVANIRELSS